MIPLRRVLLALAISLPGTQASAQQALFGPGAAFISIGGARVATEALDERLAAHSYPTFGNRAGSGGIGGYRIFRKKLLLGAEITGLDLGQKPHNGSDVWVGGGHATLGLGFVKQLSPRLRIYPRFGIGAGGLTMTVRAVDTITFDNALATPAPAPTDNRHLSRDGGVIDLGGGLELLPRRGDWSPLIGVRVGYLATFFGSDSNWQMIGGTAFAGPAASIAGPYLRVTIGAAWKR